MGYTIGIDQSLTSTGIVVLHDGEPKAYKVITTDKAYDKFTRMMEAAEYIINFIQRLDKYSEEVERVIIEGLPFGMRQSNVTRDLAGLQAVIVTSLQENLKITIEEELHIVAPTTIKKYATGSGKATKDQLFEALPESVQKVFEAVPKTKGRFDLTDAYWLAKYGDTL